MRLAVIASMLSGLQELVAQCRTLAIDELDGMQVYRMTYAGHPIFAACGGIGIVNSALATQRLIARYKPDAVANIGVAGALVPELDIGDVVLVRDTIYNDFDNKQLEVDFPFLAKDAFQSDPKLLALCEAACKKSRTIGGYIVGRTVSGQGFIADDAVRRRLVKTYHAQCVDRDSTGAAHACYILGVPYIGVRCISDRATDDGEQAVKNFHEYLKFASKQSSEVLLSMLNDLN